MKQLKESMQDELMYLISRVYKSVLEAAEYINIKLIDQEYASEMLEEAKKRFERNSSRAEDLNVCH